MLDEKKKPADEKDKAPAAAGKGPEETGEKDPGTGAEATDTAVETVPKEEFDKLLSENTGQADYIGELEAKNKELEETVEKRDHALKSMAGKLKKAGVKDDSKIIRHE